MNNLIIRTLADRARTSTRGAKSVDFTIIAGVPVLAYETAAPLADRRRWVARVAIAFRRLWRVASPRERAALLEFFHGREAGGIFISSRLNATEGHLAHSSSSRGRIVFDGHVLDRMDGDAEVLFALLAHEAAHSVLAVIDKGRYGSGGGCGYSQSRLGWKAEESFVDFFAEALWGADLTRMHDWLSRVEWPRTAALAVAVIADARSGNAEPNDRDVFTVDLDAALGVAVRFAAIEHGVEPVDVLIHAAVEYLERHRRHVARGLPPPRVLKPSRKRLLSTNAARTPRKRRMPRQGFP